MGMNIKKKNITKPAISTLNFHIISLFPDSFDSYIDKSIIGRAIKNKYIKVDFYDPRDFVKPTKAQSKNENPLLKVDGKPYGGGPGMIIKAEPILKSIEKVFKKKSVIKNKTLIVFLAPGGKVFDTELANTFSKKYKDIIIICGRYEGIDSRVKKVFKMIDVSVGPWVTTGGELPALVMIDVIARQIDGVLGKIESLEESRVSSGEMYTRPEVLVYKNKKYKVPKVLLSGNHKLIEEYKLKE
jgi:tRNA (guanine37-N1)-methyltransferase